MQIHNAVITGSFSYNGADLSNVTSSNAYSASLSTRVTQIENVYATTGSNSFRANQSITGSLTVSSTLTAQTLVVSIVSSSIEYSSGSNIFGSSLTNTQTFTGSVNITGSLNSYAKILINKDLEGLTVNGGTSANAAYMSFQANTQCGWLIVGSQGSTSNYIQTGTGANESAITTVGAYALSFGTNQTERMRITASGSVGIGATSPLGRLEVADYTAGVTAGDFIVNTCTKYVYVGRQSSTSGDNTTFVVRDRTGASRATIPGGGSIDTTFSTNSSNFIVTNYSGASLMTIANTGATTFSGAVTGNQFVIPASSTYRLNTNTDGLLGYMLRSGTWKGTSENHLSLATDSANGIAFYTNGSGTERMLITASGSVLVGTTTENTTVSKLQVKADSGAQAISAVGRASDGISQYMFMNAANSGIYGFMQGSSDGGGRITMVANSAGGVYLASGATSWTAVSSDIRKKKNFETTQGLNEVLQIEPIKYHFNWEEDTSNKRLGFKAQNILPLIPEMVSATGEVAEDGSDYLTITPDYILPVLVKAIQELKAEFEEYKATHP